MAKRAAPGPFAAAPIVQGKLDGSGVPDVVSLSRGTPLADNWCANFDPYQGSFVFWITPEWAGNDNLDHEIFLGSSAIQIYKLANSTLNLLVGSVSLSVSVSSWTAGTTYCVVLRWDSKNTLDGTNYACISINDVHSFGDTTTASPNAPDTTMFVGSYSSTAYSANAIIEGLTIYRRPLFDGTYGSNVGNGDEVNLIYAAGVGKDPCEVTGSWDVVLCLPTASTPGALVTNALDAWSHPHGSAVLTDSYAQTTYASSGWTTKGTPSTGPVDSATANKIFNWGYTWISDADAEGVQQSKTGLTAGQNYVIRCIAYNAGTGSIRLRVRDDTNGADIVAYVFGASTYRTLPGVAIITFELPTTARNGVGANCTAITISVESTESGAAIVLSQCEVQVNLVDNPSLETGAGDPWIPSGWTIGAGSPSAGEFTQELVDIHSGASSLKGTGNAFADFVQQALSSSVGTYQTLGFWGKETSGAADMGETNSSFQSALATAVSIALDSSSWKHYGAVCRVTIANPAIYTRPASSGTFYMDDIYAFALTPVTLTCTPASLANSTETSGIRVDGSDVLTQPLSNLTATYGKIRFRYTPRHSAADQVKFGVAVNNPHLVTMHKISSSNAIQLYWSAANTLSLYLSVGGVATTTNWNATGAIAAGTTYLIEIEYNAVSCTVKVDGVLRITTTPAAGINFGADVPNAAYWGTYLSSTHQADAAYAAP